MTSEEDASMALQVSNALTQALLQFRMNNLPKEVNISPFMFCLSHISAAFELLLRLLKQVFKSIDILFLLLLVLFCFVLFVVFFFVIFVLFFLFVCFFSKM